MNTVNGDFKRNGPFSKGFSPYQTIVFQDWGKQPRQEAKMR